MPAHQTAVLGARRQLLTDVAALFEIDAVECLEAALHQRRPADFHVAAAVGRAVGDAVALVVGDVAAREARLLHEREVTRPRQNRPKPEGASPGIAHDGAAGAGHRAAFARRQVEGAVHRAVLAAEERDHPKILGRIGERDIGAQPVGYQPAPEVADTRPLAVEQIARAVAQHEEVVQEFALGRQQRRVDAALVRHALDVVGDQPLEEGAGLGAAYGDDAAIVEWNVERGAHRRISGPPASRHSRRPL